MIKVSSFGAITRSEALDAPVQAALISALSDAIGFEGLCAGQERDLRDISFPVSGRNRKNTIASGEFSAVRLRVHVFSRHVDSTWTEISAKKDANLSSVNVCVFMWPLDKRF